MADPPQAPKTLYRQSLIGEALQIVLMRMKEKGRVTDALEASVLQEFDAVMVKTLASLPTTCLVTGHIKQVRDRLGLLRPYHTNPYHTMLYLTDTHIQIYTHTHTHTHTHTRTLCVLLISCPVQLSDESLGVPSNEPRGPGDETDGE